MSVVAKIFINYRRDDSQYQADRLHDIMKDWVDDPDNSIFIDVDNIPAGIDFVEHLDAMVQQCDALVVLIGKNWLTIKDPHTGERRLDSEEDFVRVEIEAALKRNIPVVPVLLDGTSMPPAHELPDGLKPLARRNGIQISRLSFKTDADRLRRSLPIALADPKPVWLDFRFLAAAFVVGLFSSLISVAWMIFGSETSDPAGPDNVVASADTDSVSTPSFNESSIDFQDPLDTPPTQPAMDGPRLALVIGNEAYLDDGMRLAYSAADAERIAQALRETGFGVRTLINAGELDTRRAISAYFTDLDNAGEDAVGFFYYSGHAMQLRDESYLLPVDFQFEGDWSLSAQAVRLDDVIDRLSNFRLNANFVVLDATKDMSVDSAVLQDAVPGLNPNSALNARNLFVTWSQSVGGSNARDGTSPENQVFARELANLITTPGLHSTSLFRQLQTNVAGATGMQQMPAYVDQTTSDFCFSACPE